MEIPQKVRGMQDIFGEYQRYFTFLKKVARHEFRKNGFTRISTPMLEHLELIARGVGEETDIVSKEMYAFKDRGDRDLVLKPESTAGVMRAYIENLLDEPQPVYLYYIEPHFRYERPQKGRFRQFHQIGAEIIGEADPLLDAMCMRVMASILESIGIPEYTLKINSLGTLKEREKYIEELKAFFETRKSILDEGDLRRLEKNPLRLLDSKNEEVKDLFMIAPKITDYLKKDSLQFYTQVKEYLGILGVKYVEDTSLVRGLDYYSHTVWEFVDGSGRTQDALGGGGRYDSLSKTIGYKTEIPAVGFAFGMERLASHIMDAGVHLKNKDQLHLYFIALGDDAKKSLLPCYMEARKAGINSLMGLGESSLKSQMKKANRYNARYVAIVGIMEAKKGVCQLRNMSDGTQKEVPISLLITETLSMIDPKELDFYSPTRDFVVEKKAETSVIE